MPYTTHSVLVYYSAEQMFSLTKDIRTYPKFISRCSANRILKQDGRKLTAEINVFKASISRSFSTRNVVTENKSIMMRLVKGTFSSFFGLLAFNLLRKNNKKASMVFIRLAKEV